MARIRSKSIVQNIASKVVTHASEEWKPESELNETQQLHNPLLHIDGKRVGSIKSSKRHRSKSLPSDSIVPTSQGQVLENDKSEVPLYPFLQAEEEKLTQDYLKSHSFNSILDYNHISDINDYYDDQLLGFQTDCDRNIEYFLTLLKDTNDIMEQLGSLTFQYDQVMKDTEEFASQSRDLLNKQKELGKRADEMDHVMKMFEPLESISKALSTSGTNLIRSGRWRTILIQAQQNLEFFNSHKTYKDAEIYTIRYRQCITRALTLVRNYNIDFLKDKMKEVFSRLNAGDFDPLKLDIMMYSEFSNELEKQTDNTKFSTLIRAIADQCEDHKEYQGLVSDVLHQYFKLRRMLVLAYLEKQAPEISEQQISKNEGRSQGSEDIVKYCQRAVSQFKRLLDKENTLFNKYFPFENFDKSFMQFVDGELYAFLKQLLEPFYDDMRNKIIKETSITELTHLTNLLNSYFELEDDTASNSSVVENKLEYGELLEPTLKDSQARLIFRIQNYIDNKLLKYKPKPEDLQLGNRRSSARRESVLDEYEGNLFPELYIPVGKALTILSNLYELVNSMVFDDIAHYIVHNCIFMLKNGAMNLAVSHLGPADAKLFYLKNLTMLRTHVNAFDIQFVRTETSLDLTGGIQELIRIFRSGRLAVTFNSQGGFLELVKKSVPKVINDMIDAKKEIELELSNSFNDYITECTNLICEPILNDDGASLKEKATKLSDNVLMKIPHIHKQVIKYIEEEDFVTYLLNVLSRLIYNTYESYHRTAEENLTSTEHAEELNEIMEPDTFFNFLAETINSLEDSLELTHVGVEFNEDILNGRDEIFQEDLESELENEQSIQK